jgi:glucokinase
MKNGMIAGADIGGSHIAVALIDTATREIIPGTRKRKEIDTSKSAEEIFASWSYLIKQSFETVNTKPSKIGIAMPGPFDYVNGISYIKDQNKYDSLYGLNIKEKLAEKLEVSINDILILNDAACFLRGEVFCGAGQGFKQVMGLTLGTGFGSARSLNGKTEDADLWCAPFREGIAEDYLSTRWFLKQYKMTSGQVVKNVKELAGRFRNDHLARDVFYEFGATLAEFLGPYITKEQMDMVILGGNISLAFKYFSESLMKSLAHTSAETQIRTTILGENAALIGAASSHYLSSANLISK